MTWPEAIALGIDDFEHGPVFTDTEFVAEKTPDVCPRGGGASWAKQDINGAAVQALIQNLVKHHVAVIRRCPFSRRALRGGRRSSSVIWMRCLMNQRGAI